MTLENFTEDLGNGVKLEMIAIPGGSFLMGSEDFDDTKPVHPVTLSPFHIGKFQVTQQQWQAVMGNNPSHFKGDNLPVETVSWNDAVSFCERLSEMTTEKYRNILESDWIISGSQALWWMGYVDTAEAEWYNAAYEHTTNSGVSEMQANRRTLHDQAGMDSRDVYSVREGAGILATAGRQRQTTEAATVVQKSSDSVLGVLSQEESNARWSGCANSVPEKVRSIGEREGQEQEVAPRSQRGIASALCGLQGGTGGQANPSDCVRKVCYYAASENWKLFWHTGSSLEGLRERESAERAMALQGLPLSDGSSVLMIPVTWITYQVWVSNNPAAKYRYQLPSESCWEYACRAGSTGKYCFGDDESLLKDYAWYNKNSDSKTHPVGEKLPNKWGLHDMHGNVWEWCSDWYNANYYAELSKQGEVVNPQGPANGEYRALRGGSWIYFHSNARAVFRYNVNPGGRDYDVGFRVVVFRPPSELISEGALAPKTKPEIPAAMLDAATAAVAAHACHVKWNDAEEARMFRNQAEAALEAAGVLELLDERDRLTRERNNTIRLLELHQRFHYSVSCPGKECYVCQAEE